MICIYYPSSMTFHCRFRVIRKALNATSLFFDVWISWSDLLIYMMYKSSKCFQLISNTRLEKRNGNCSRLWSWGSDHPQNIRYVAVSRRSRITKLKPQLSKTCALAHWTSIRCIYIGHTWRKGKVNKYRKSQKYFSTTKDVY